MIVNEVFRNTLTINWGHVKLPSYLKICTKVKNNTSSFENVKHLWKALHKSLMSSLFDTKIQIHHFLTRK